MGPNGLGPIGPSGSSFQVRPGPDWGPSEPGPKWARTQSFDAVIGVLNWYFPKVIKKLSHARYASVLEWLSYRNLERASELRLA